MAYRGISDTVGRSESLAALSDTAERLYWRLLAHTDPYGRLPGSPAKTRALCFPLLSWTHDDVGAALAELEAVGRVWVYDVEGQACIQVTEFDENQPSEFIRRRGKTRIPECPPLKSGSCTDYSRSLYKLPANDHHSGSSPGVLRTTPAPKQGNAKQGKYLTQQQHVARETAPEPNADAALDNLLEQLGVNGATRTAARQDIPRATACATVALNASARNPAGYFRALLESGDWPTARTDEPDHGVNRPPADPAAAIGSMIRNGAIANPHDLDTEIAASHLTDDQARELRALLATLWPHDHEPEL